MSTSVVPAPSRRLFSWGLVIFVLTIVIGILNGIDVVDFGRNTLLTHVHAGTLGWLTLSIVGAALWMFGSPDDAEDPATSRLAAGTGLAVAIYVVAFWTGNEVFRPIAGTLMFAAVAMIVVWVGRRAAGVARHIPRLAMLLSLVSLLFGAVLGILLGLAVTGDADWVPSGVAEAHPPTMVIGYLVLAALGLAEWRLTGDQVGRAAAAVADGEAPRLGQVQVWLVFAAGIVLVLGIIFEVEPLIIANAPLEMVGIGIFVRRLWPDLRAIEWTMPGAARWMGASVVFLVLNLALLVYLVGSSQGDFDTIRFSLILALDHLMFVGVLTNALFAVVRDAAPDVRGASDTIAFAGINLGLSVFVLGLLGDWVWLKRIGTPILGLALLHAVAVGLLALTGRGRGAATAEQIVA